MPKYRIYNVHLSTTAVFPEGLSEKAMVQEVKNSIFKVLDAPTNVWLHYTGTVLEGDVRKEA